MAPEILSYQKYDAKADLWSVGSILYELLVGRTPFTGMNPMQLLRNIERQDAKIPSKVANALSPECVSMLRALLRRNPAERATFEEFFSHPFLTGEKLPNPPPARTSTSTSTAGRPMSDRDRATGRPIVGGDGDAMDRRRETATAERDGGGSRSDHSQSQSQSHSGGSRSGSDGSRDSSQMPFPFEDDARRGGGGVKPIRVPDRGGGGGGGPRARAAASSNDPTRAHTPPSSVEKARRGVGAVAAFARDAASAAATAATSTTHWLSSSPLARRASGGGGGGFSLSPSPSRGGWGGSGSRSWSRKPPLSASPSPTSRPRRFAGFNVHANANAAAVSTETDAEGFVIVSGESGAFYTLVPIRPRRRGERRSLRTLPGASLRPGSLAFNPRPRRLSTPQLTPFNSTPTFARIERPSPSSTRAHADRSPRASSSTTSFTPPKFAGVLARRLSDAGGKLVSGTRDTLLSFGTSPRRRRGVGAEVRSIHWFPYDRVGVVNADP